MDGEVNQRCTKIAQKFTRYFGGGSFSNTQGFNLENIIKFGPEWFFSLPSAFCSNKGYFWLKIFPFHKFSHSEVNITSKKPALEADFSKVSCNHRASSLKTCYIDFKTKMNM